LPLVEYPRETVQAVDRDHLLDLWDRTRGFMRVDLMLAPKLTAATGVVAACCCPSASLRRFFVCRAIGAPRSLRVRAAWLPSAHGSTGESMARETCPAMLLMTSSPVPDSARPEYFG